MKMCIIGVGTIGGDIIDYIDAMAIFEDVLKISIDTNYSAFAHFLISL